MPRNQKKYLFDIQRSIEIIFTHHLDGIDTKEAFARNITVINAVERQIGIIGEGVYRLRQMGLSLSQADRIINFRNSVIHNYDDIRSDTIWYFTMDLKQLQLEVKESLSSLEG